MSEFRIFETEEFLNRLGDLQIRDSRQIRTKLRDYVYPQIRMEPFFGLNFKKFRGYSPATWRYRIGGFRIFYTVDSEEGILYILSIDRRRETYR